MKMRITLLYQLKVSTGEFFFLRKIFFMLIVSFRALYTRNHTEIVESEVWKHWKCIRDREGEGVMALSKCPVNNTHPAPEEVWWVACPGSDREDFCQDTFL